MGFGVRKGLLALALAVAVWSQPAIAEQDAAASIRAVIEDQVAAFADGDAQRAFGHATPDIQARFGSSAVFMSMVETGYAALIRPTKFQIQEIEARGDEAAARALVIARDGRAYQAIYPMKRQADGGWRIDGCHLTPAEGRSL